MPTVTRLRDDGRGRVAVELDDAPWRTLPVDVVARSGLVEGRALDRGALRLLRQELRRRGAGHCDRAAPRTSERASQNDSPRRGQRPWRVARRSRRSDSSTTRFADGPNLAGGLRRAPSGTTSTAGDWADVIRPPSSLRQRGARGASWSGGGRAWARRYLASKGSARRPWKPPLEPTLRPTRERRKMQILIQRFACTGTFSESLKHLRNPCQPPTSPTPKGS